MKIAVRVSANAKTAHVKEVVEEGRPVIAVRVDAPPREGRANKRLIEILADYFSVPKSNVKIVSGARSKRKTVLVHREGRQEGNR